MFGVMGGYVGGNQDFDEPTTSADIQSGVFGRYVRGVRRDFDFE